MCTEDGRSLSNRLELSVTGPDGQTTERPTNREEPKEPPPAPQNLTAVVNKNGSVTLVWDAPDDDSVTGYQVLRRRPTMDEDTLLVHVEDTGSTATTYTDSDVTGGVRHVYQVKAINAAGLSERSNHVKVDPPEREANAPASGAPVITGTAQVGETLTADTSGVADEDGLDDVSFSYQWTVWDGSADTDILDATESTYELTGGDAGKRVKVRVSFTDDAGNDETLASAPTEAVAATAPDAPLNLGVLRRKAAGWTCHGKLPNPMAGPRSPATGSSVRSLPLVGTTRKTCHWPRPVTRPIPSPV